MLTMSSRYLQLESAAHRGTGGVSAENRDLGFVPAFLDTDTGIIYPSTFADGRPAPVHVLDGFPDEVVLARDLRGRVARVVGSIIAGFLRESRFYTRDEAAKLVAAQRSSVPA